MSWPRASVEEALRSSMGSDVEVEGLVSLSGGDINEAGRLDTSRGPLFLKWNRAPLPGLFSAEAAGLRALAASGTRLVVPEVIAWSDPSGGDAGFLLTRFLQDGPRAADFDETLGLGLADLHAATRDRFGFDVDNYIGTTPQPNPDTDTWVEFYREHRVGYQVRLARDHGRLSAKDAALSDRLCQRFDDLLVGGRPALIHGDLWAGNLHRDAGRPALIDPATYFGHPEAELGMMTLFGGFSAKTYEVYEEASGLDRDWRQRSPLYELYHVLNHANLFGGGYAAQAMRIVRRYAG